MKLFCRIEVSDFPAGGVVDPNGVYHKVRFKDGVAFLNWRKLGEHETLVAAQAFGHDPRFRVTEILESDYIQLTSKRRARIVYTVGGTKPPFDKKPKKARNAK